jgi:hypothetical protein
MGLIDGDNTAESGMSKAIYDQLRFELEPALGEISKENLDAIQKLWRQLASAVARGVIQHIKTNMEIFGIQTRGNVNASVSGNTSPASGHSHGVNLTGLQSNVVFTQSNDGTGHVR